MEFNRIGPRTVEVTDGNGNIILFTQCTTKNGVQIQDSDVDGENYIKMGYEYFKKNDIAEAVLPDYSFTDGFDI